MKEIQLTQGKVARVDDIDYEYLSQFKWYFYAGYAKRKGPSPDRKTIPMHCVIAERMGLQIDGLEVDHEDQVKLNNQRYNLRPATKAQQKHNEGLQRNNESGFVGVSFHKRVGKWRARIELNSKEKHLGYFETALEAALARDDAAKELRGEFVWLNNPQPDEWYL